MHMIGRPIDFQARAADAADNAAHVFEQVLFDFRRDKSLPAFRAKHDVIDQFRIRSRHALALCIVGVAAARLLL
jgi:hypothetical protein